MMRDDAFNSYVYPVRTEMTAPSSHIYSMEESELKKFLVNKTLSQSCSTDEDEPKGIIVDECSTEDDESELKGIIINECSTEEEKSECVINKKKYAKNEVTYNMSSYFNIFECGRKLLNKLDVSHEQVCMATPRDEYYTNLLEIIVN